MKFTIRGHEFDIPELFVAGHIATPAEAQVINRTVEKAVRNAINAGAINSRAEAIAFAASDSALNDSTAAESRTNIEDLL